MGTLVQQASWKDWQLWALIVFALASGTAAWIRVTPNPPSFAGVHVGDDLSAIEMMSADGRTQSLATGEPLVLLIFRSDCSWCRSNAPVWKEWLDSGPELRVVAVTSESVEVGEAYATELGWSVGVRQIKSGLPTSRAAALLSRTPWVFLIAPNGTLEAEMHGSKVGDLHSLAITHVYSYLPPEVVGS